MFQGMLYTKWPKGEEQHQSLPGSLQQGEEGFGTGFVAVGAVRVCVLRHVPVACGSRGKGHIC